MPSIYNSIEPIREFPYKFTSPFGNDAPIPVYSSVPPTNIHQECFPCMVCENRSDFVEITSVANLKRGISGGVDRSPRNPIVVVDPVSYCDAPPYGWSFTIPECHSGSYYFQESLCGKPIYSDCKTPKQPLPDFDCNELIEIEPDYVWQEELSSPYIWCQSFISGRRVFVNPKGSPARAVFCGSVDDDIAINGEIAQFGKFVFSCGLNGSHAFGFYIDVAEGEQTIVEAINHFTYLTSINLKVYYLTIPT